MDIDENDLLSSNVYIPYPELEKEISSQSMKNLKSFMKKNNLYKKKKIFVKI